MKIKRIQSIVYATLTLVQLSCSSDSDEVVYDENNPHPNAESSLIGTWVLEGDNSVTQTFKWDGTIIYSNGSIKNYNVKNPDGYSEQYDCDLLVMEFISLEGNSTTTTRICKSNDFILYWSSESKYLKM